MPRSGSQSRTLIFGFIGLLILSMVVIKSLRYGTDINVYLYASQQLGLHENIYSGNPYNDYLYSPLFALLLRPLSLLDFSIARVLWALINAGLTYRMWRLAQRVLQNIPNINQQLLTRWNVGLLIISVGVLLHNLNLGQITVVILWLTFEGLYQIMVRERNMLGATWLALGINIKIIPLLAIFYLTLKGKFLPVALVLSLTLATLVIPAIPLGWKYNTELLTHWKNKINPSGNKYLFEKSNGCSSVNAILPAFFHSFPEPEDHEVLGFKRKIVFLPDSTLLYMIQGIRLLLLISVVYICFLQFIHGPRHLLSFFWEFSFLMLVSILFFPHQMKYSLLYFVPAGSYMLLYALAILKFKNQELLKEKVIAWLSLILLFIFSVTGRDIIGKAALKVIDFYHVHGFILLLFLPLMMMARPGYLLNLFALNKPIPTQSDGRI